MKTTRCLFASPTTARARRRHRRAPGGFALILTLLILSVLAVVAVSFLSSMAAERATANAFANRVRAEQAAHAGADSAMALLKSTLQSYPDSATAWDATQTKNDGNTSSFNEGTTLFLRAKANSAGDAPDPNVENNRPPTDANTPDARQTFVLPLVSGASPKLLSNKAAATPTLNVSVTDPTKQNFYNLNAARSAGDTRGWVGSPPGATSPKPARSPWVEFKFPPANDPTTTDPTKLVTTSRYAFWVEDESFKANLNLITRPPVPLGANDPFRLLRPENASLAGLLASLNDTSAATDAGNLFDTRAAFPLNLFPNLLSINNDTATTTALRDDLRYLTTLNSGGLNLSRHGSRRLNLNRIIRANPDTTQEPNRLAIRRELDQIIQTVLFHSPNFGQRFYRQANSTDAGLNDVTVVSGNHPTIYMNKIAANIRDYIDKDSQPTVVRSDGTIANFPAPVLAMGGESNTNEIWAIGKEPLPLLTEYVLRVKQFAPLPNTRTSPAAYNIQIDHYVEFWNMTNRDITAADLGNNPYISIVNQPGWTGSNGIVGDNIPNNAARDITINLNSIPNLVFKAGAHTVITTDKNPPPTTSPNYQGASFIPDRSLLFTANIPDSQRNYTGRTANIITGYPTLLLDAKPGPAGINAGMDFQTELVLGNAVGYLDSQQNAGALQAAMAVDGYNGSRINNQAKTDTTQFHFRGAAPLGNLPPPPSTQAANGSPLNLGDPRNHAEQIQFTTPVAGVSQSQQTRWQPTNTYGTANADQYIPRQNTLGSGNSNFLNPGTGTPNPGTRWGDPSGLLAGADKAPANFPPPADPNDASWRALTSIGQLGDIYDPVRATVANIPITLSSGGGRTFRIGQKEGGSASAGALYDGQLWSRSREWAAWRLTDFFYAGDPRPGYDRNGNPAPANQTEDLLLPGMINLNGLTRDNGAALRAVLDQYAFLTNGNLLDPSKPETKYNPKVYLTDPSLSGRTLPDSGRDKLINAIITRLTDANLGPFFERGELSEISLFSAGSDLAGVDMGASDDRGREELFRRLVERTTTRGNIFSVYVYGQAISQPTATANKRITGSSRFKVTFALVPVFDPPLASDEQYDPSNPSDSQSPLRTIKRFRPPDRYDIQVLQTSS